MTWLLHVTAGWTDGQLWWLATGLIAFVWVTGWVASAEIVRRYRRRQSHRLHPANPRPYDWARDDCRLRQAVNVHRRVS